jgi:hypothetical protein
MSSKVTYTCERFTLKFNNKHILQSLLTFKAIYGKYYFAIIKFAGTIYMESGSNSKL